MATRLNPSKGSRPDKLMRDALILELSEKINEGRDKGSKKLRLVARALIDKGLTGDVQAIKEINDRVDGKAPQALTDPDGGPLSVKIISFSAHDHTPK